MILVVPITLDSSGDLDPITIPAGAWGVRRARFFEPNAGHEYYLAGRVGASGTELSLHTIGQIHEFNAGGAGTRRYAPGEILAYGKPDSGTVVFCLELEM